ncbi:hypothetical protein [Deinococcus hopiensis]|uniref:DUF4139 domain-containing protein n=1 Tax=Deinococcus hopiensis KR-140 TaxID=695939 RepID=A0A1W1UAF4_9DEIO|nr:hypothetical protein [Deinococcus hopiensis]SMB78049.1 hypothetical protein SAMN00790413_06468 [Deinococcus hopiensis KR-140]
MTKSLPPGVALRLYPSFAEVRLRVESAEPRLTFTFPPEAWRRVIPQSLALVGLSPASMTLTPQQTGLSLLEGRKVWWRSPEGRQEVTLIRAEDLLVQDQEGAYFNVQKQHLLFPEPPPLSQSDAMTATFELHEPGQGLISYLTQSLSWKALYTLEVNATGNAELTAYAELENASDQPLVPDEVKLLAGQVELSGGRRRMDFSRGILGMVGTAQLARSLPELEEAGEVAGLYSFGLKHPPVLPARSTVTVPFQPVSLQSFQAAVTLLNTFGTYAQHKGVGLREYTLTAGQPLLGAQVMVREQGYTVGQSSWQETAAGESVTFTLGRDPDVTYTRTATFLDEPEADPAIKKRKATYRVTYSFRNAKSRSVQLRLHERISEAPLALEGEVTWSDGELIFEQVLQPGEIRDMTYQVTIPVEG